MTKRIDIELEEEIAYFNAHKADLLSKYEGRFVLIKDSSCYGCFTTEAEAYEEGLKHFGNEPFLIKKVTKEEETDKIPALVLGLINADL